VIPIDTIEFLTELYGDAEGYMTLWTKHDKKTYWLPLDNLNNIAETALSIEKDVYFGVGIASQKNVKGRLFADDITGVPGLWIDLDLKDDKHPNNPTDVKILLDYVNKLPFEPSIIIFSGHGIHCHWLFREFLNIESDAERQQIKSLFKGWQEFIRKGANILGWKVDSTHDLSRVLRLPGTVNYKYPDSPVDVTVIANNPRRYNPSDFDEYATEPETVSEKRNKFKRNPSDGPAQSIIDNCIFI
jgi:putative DNA primase/helicase